MMEIVKHAFQKTPFYDPLRRWAAKRRGVAALAEWEKRGRPIPPPHIVKQKILRDYSKKYSLRILVETGTCYGDMVDAMKADFDQIYSIELDKDLYEKAFRRFRKAKNVELIHGDSGIELEGLMKRMDQPALFWLDGHYSAGVTARGAKDTPIREELHHILHSNDLGHVVIIDDARCFGQDPAYPSIEELDKMILSLRPNMDIVIQDDIIRITPKQQS
jgi:hypothetical protein